MNLATAIKELTTEEELAAARRAVIAWSHYLMSVASEFKWIRDDVDDFINFTLVCEINPPDKTGMRHIVLRLPWQVSPEVYAAVRAAFTVGNDQEIVVKESIRPLNAKRRSA